MRVRGGPCSVARSHDKVRRDRERSEAIAIRRHLVDDTERSTTVADRHRKRHVGRTRDSQRRIVLHSPPRLGTDTAVDGESVEPLPSGYGAYNIWLAGRTSAWQRCTSPRQAGQREVEAARMVRIRDEPAAENAGEA